MSKWCASCQQEREEGKFCMECGTALTEPGSTCTCGYPLKPDAKFCPECGQPVVDRNGAAASPATESDPLMCPVCNTIQEDDSWRFCGACGEKNVNAFQCHAKPVAQESSDQESVPEFKKQLADLSIKVKVLEEEKEALLSKQLVTQNHPRYAKLGHGGIDLSDNATREQGWLMTRDKHTGLIWEIKAKDNMNEKYTWDEAKTVFVKRLNMYCFGGVNDWRLPKKEELETLIKEGNRPAIDSDWFPFTVSSGYWSSSAYNANVAWRVHFGSGRVNYDGKPSNFYVRAVRVG